ncbi:anaerobic ribonucleoside-triphosphate reductase activating protein [Methanosphaera sp. ISO3-F5]|uniref:anaerobic ribonucleoside-triphosphate reductase activating protein n=1 Tax=Methanosphaera sp. ISO3-F5 TaxID=1452353 RepID=UPI002B261D93|nr:anaerobic ribonucleoside-triphosphate reductase activating protein [Methanosphaera sp. ISO3-F5]WQH64321.1 anaerobic ribonucleoside-triphosphate reductase activating protein [Methanosphaera sp. ISO3-F5]
MNIQPTYSSLDYPGKMSLVLFTPGCDLRCKYCHNPQLLKNQQLTRWDIEEIEAEVESNMDFIDAIVLSGGEPLLHVEDIKNFIKQAKDSDLLVKLDTNGLHPDETREIIKDLDYVAMDIKAPLDKYYKITDVYPKDTEELIRKTINIINDNNVFLECRTTYVPQLLEPSDIQELTANLDCDRYTLQQFRNRVTLDANLSNYEEPNPEFLREILEKLETNIPEIRLKSRQFGNQLIKG